MLISLAIYFSVGIVNAQSCFNYSCAILPENVCAKREGNTININTSGCAETHECMVADIQNLVNRGEMSNNQEIKCVLIPSVVVDQSAKTCYSNDWKRLRVVSYPKSCTTSSDCLLEDLTKGVCECGLSGKRECRPDDLDPNFGAWFWDLCG
jgi:hypothetical protein